MQGSKKMTYFKDTGQFYNILVPFFNKLKDDPEIGPKVFASNLIIKFIYHNPEAVIFIHSPNKEVIQGDREDVKPDVKMEMNSDVAHRFWLGKVNLMVALTKGDIKAKGPIPKIMKLLPIIRDSYAIYKDYLKEEGFEDLVNIE